MGFLDTLRHVLGRDRDREQVPEALARAWGLGGGEGAAEEAGPTPSSGPESEAQAGAEGADSSEYDRAQWRKKMARILDGLPASRPAWAVLMTEAKALKLNEAWMHQCQVEEFRLLVRRAVADRKVSASEHHKLDLARDLIGIPEDDAEVTLRSVIAEAETFFGRPVTPE
jgi:hypothetical protein